jgi:uncharacterized RDD family membrane protein YckC
VALPFQILAALLFAATAGFVQMDSGVYRACATSKDIPAALVPTPPHDSNFARLCKVSFFGAPTAAILTVGRVTRNGASTTTVSQGYRLDAAGKQIGGFSLDGIAGLSFAIYLVAMLSRTGRSLGDRAVGIRLVDGSEPGLSVVPLRKVILRYLAMALGFVPMFAALILAYLFSDRTADGIFTADTFRWFGYSAGLGALWCLVLTIQIAMKRDPFYDRLAGTAVVRD